MDRFWDKVKVASDDECWEWQAGTCGSGYGRFAIENRKVDRAQRVACQVKGSRNQKDKLTESKVAALLSEHFKQGKRKADLARDYDLSKTTVGRIVSGKLWPHVEGRV